jgi:Na+/H+-translocating membrane pyrophosphatase
MPGRVLLLGPKRLMGTIVTGTICSDLHVHGGGPGTTQKKYIETGTTVLKAAGAHKRP